LASARSFGLQAALALAKVYQSTARPVDAHAVLAPAVEGFAPTPEMPEIAEAQALLAALAETTEVKAAIAQRQRRLDLQTSYAQAVLWSKGRAADETKAAFDRIGDLAGRAEARREQFLVLYGQAVWSMMRGELRGARDIAEQFFREAEEAGQPAVVGVGHRLLGFANMHLGDLTRARTHLELALDSHVRQGDRQAGEKFGFDAGVAAGAFLGFASWFLGDFQRARRLIEDAVRLGREVGHLPSTIHALCYEMFVESLRNDPNSVVADAENLLRISEQYGVEMYMALSRVFLSWAKGRLGDARLGANELQMSLAAYTSQGNRLGTPWILGLLAELEAAAGDADRALALIEEGLATAQTSGDQIMNSFLYGARGDILRKGNPANPAPAEDAYRTAIAVAKQQGARSCQLLASLSLAKLYQSTARSAHAHAVLAPALEGFSPTPEMPEIAEAEVLLGELSSRAG
jgi:tetratricopeptide (TPR) repeat protein